jgi:hypothetical protein
MAGDIQTNETRCVCHTCYERAVIDGLLLTWRVIFGRMKRSVFFTRAVIDGLLLTRRVIFGRMKRSVFFTRAVIDGLLLTWRVNQTKEAR